MPVERMIMHLMQLLLLSSFAAGTVVHAQLGSSRVPSTEIKGECHPDWMIECVMDAVLGTKQALSPSAYWSNERNFPDSKIWSQRECQSRETAADRQRQAGEAAQLALVSTETNCQSLSGHQTAQQLKHQLFMTERELIWDKKQRLLRRRLDAVKQQMQYQTRHRDTSAGHDLDLMRRTNSQAAQLLHAVRKNLPARHKTRLENHCAPI